MQGGRATFWPCRGDLLKKLAENLQEHHFYHVPSGAARCAHNSSASVEVRHGKGTLQRFAKPEIENPHTQGPVLSGMSFS